MRPAILKGNRNYINTTGDFVQEGLAVLTLKQIKSLHRTGHVTTRRPAKLAV